MVVEKDLTKVQEEFANINDGKSSKEIEVIFNPQTGELELDVVSKKSRITITDIWSGYPGCFGSEKRPGKVQEEIADINKKVEAVFTSELEVANKTSEITPNATTITDVAKDGFAGEKRPREVQDEIARINDGNSSKEVAFDPRTGELEVVSRTNKITPNLTTISDVAGDGFAGEKRPMEVQDEIARINDGNSSKEVAFDPRTGELEVVSRRSEITPNLTTISDVAGDGFAAKPIVYTYEDEITEFLQSGGDPLKRGVAFEWKDEDVYHVHLKTPKTSVSGSPCMAFFYVHISDGTSIEFSNIANALCITQYLQDKGFQNKAIVCVFNIDNSKITTHAYLVFNDGTMIECNIQYVPKKSELYSRSKGLLEVDILEKKSIAIIGLGSFGSNVSIELAKAGVGKFKLFDFDRVELSNIARHTCGINELGRYKTHAIRDAILQKNPFANVETFEININEHEDLLISEIKDVDVILCLTDENRSRSRLNLIAVEYKKTIIYGRAITRAEAGDVFRYIPDKNKPCLACLIGEGLFNFQQEEISSERQANRDLPAYTSAENRTAAVQVGLSSDILPICNLIVKLTLVELSIGLNSGLSSLEEDLIADYYFWVNRRENKYRNLPKMEFKANQLSILRWYGVRVHKDENCLICNQ